MKDSEKGIALFDSGVGGLSVLYALQKIFPYEKYYYLADTLHLPYGNKSSLMIEDLCFKNATFLTRFSLKALVVACNTASALAYQSLLKRFNVPLFDVITPALSKVIEVSRNKKIAILATESTIRSKAYELGIMKREPKAQVFSIACPLLVPLVEENLIGQSLTKKVIQHYLSALKGTHVDTLVLGCTHYPLLKPLIQEELGEGIEIVDSALELTYCLEKYFNQNQLTSLCSTSKPVEFYVSGSTRAFKEKIKQLLGYDVNQIKKYYFK